MLPWVLPTLRVKQADKQQGTTSHAELRGESASVIATFLASVLTSCARRPHLPWSALAHALSSHSSLSTPGPTSEGDSSHPLNHIGVVTSLCSEAAHSGFVLLYSTLTAAMGRFRGQQYLTSGTDCSEPHLHRSALVEGAVWRYIADVTAAVLHTLPWSSAAASVLLSAVIDDIEDNGDKLQHVLHTSWGPIEDCNGQLGRHTKRAQRERCVLHMSRAVPKAFSALVQDLWRLASLQGSQFKLESYSNAAAALPLKRKACSAIPYGAVTLRKGRSVAEFAVDSSLPGSDSLQHAVSSTGCMSAAALLSGMFGEEMARNGILPFHGSENEGSSSEVEVFGASQECQTLLALPMIVRSCWHSSTPWDATTMATADARRVFAAVQELPSAHAELISPVLLRSIEEFCTGAAQELGVALTTPGAKSSKKAGKRSTSMQNTTAVCCRHVAAAVAAVGCSAVCSRQGVGQDTHPCNKLSLATALSAAVAAAKHKPLEFSPCRRTSCDEAVYTLCLAAVLVAAASAEGEPAEGAESQGATQRAKQVQTVSEVTRVVAQAVGAVLSCPHATRAQHEARCTSIESQLLIHDEQTAQCSPEKLQKCFSGMAEAAQQALAGVGTPAAVVMYQAHTALLESQHWGVLAEALSELCACAKLHDVRQSACDRDIAAMFLLGKACMSRAHVSQRDSFVLREGLSCHVETLYAVYDCACHMAFDAPERSAPVVHSAMTFLSAFWRACGPGGVGGPPSSVALATWQPVARDSSLQLIDFAVAGELPPDLVDAAAFVVSCSTQAASHAGQRMLAMLSSDTSVSGASACNGTLHALTIGERGPLSCALLSGALMHEHTAPELFVVGGQIAASIRPHVLRMLAHAASGGTAHPVSGKVPESCPMWEKQAALVVLAEACFRFQPLQASTRFAACPYTCFAVRISMVSLCLQ